MNTEQIKQAYITSVAARGVLRYKALQKQAMMKMAAGEITIPEGYAKDMSKAYGGGAYLNDKDNKLDLLGNGYLQSMGTSGGLGAILGAIINGARGKSVLNGALTGGGIGLGLGAGHQYLYDNFDKYHAYNPFSFLSGKALQMGLDDTQALGAKNFADSTPHANQYEIFRNAPKRVETPSSPSVS